MSSSAPPRLATWLIEHLGRGARTESLVGDLLEQYAAGRSATWYWRQVLGAVGFKLVSTARKYGLSAVSAVARLRYLLPLGMFGLLFVVLIVGLVRAPKMGIIPSPLIGKRVPQFSVPSLFAGGGLVSSDQLKGHWTLVNVWGSWCVTCHIEHPTLLMIHQQSSIPIIGIDWNDDESDARDWLDKLGNPYSAVGVDRDGRVAIDWGVYLAPESFLINPDGIVVYKHFGAITPDVWRRQFLSRMGNAPTPTGAAAARKTGS